MPTKDIVLVMGYPASGKTTVAQGFVETGYARLNRDEAGGSVGHLTGKMIALLSKGQERIVIDNLFPTRASRKPFIDAANVQGMPIRCVWVTTSIEDAQLNASLRMVRKHGKLLEPKEIQKADDPGTFPIVVIFKYRKMFERPIINEGFVSVAEVPFVRKWGPEYKSVAVLFDYDDTLRTNTGQYAWPEHPDEVRLMEDRIRVLKFLAEAKVHLLGVSNQSACSKDLPIETAKACFDRTHELLGMKLDYEFCAHRAAPPTCWCRKPFPGMAAHFIEKYKLLPEKCIMVGDQTSDKTFAARAGFNFMHANEFFRRGPMSDAMLGLT